LQGRYIPSGSYDASLIGPDDPDYSPTLPNSINDNTVDDFLTFNLTARFTVGSEDSRKIQFFMAVTNLFDVDPPLAPGNAYTNPIFFDQTGRGYRAGARLTF
jgi:outer membrane receptor protein involved in Fe transport